jgi:hypothetical protein
MFTPIILEIWAPLHGNGVSVHVKPVVYTIIFIFQPLCHSPKITYEISQVIHII